MQRRYVWLVAGLAIPQIASIAVVVVTAWFLGPAGRGEVAFAQAAAAMIAVIGGWGFYLSAASTRQTSIPRQYFDLTLLFTAAISAGVILLAVLAPTGLLTVDLALPIGLAATMTAGTTYCQRIAQARVSDLEYLVIGATPVLVSLTIVLPAVLLGASPQAVVNVWALGTGLGLLIAFIRVRRSVPSERVKPYGLLAYVRSGLAVGAANVTSFLLLRADTFILGVASTPAQVGYYSVAVAMSGLLLYGSEVLSLRTISRHTSMSDRGSYLQESFRRAWKAVGLAAGLQIPFVLVGWAVLRHVFPEFQPANAPFAILCLAAMPASFVRVLVSAASMLGQRRLLMRYSLGSLGLVVAYLPTASLGATALALASLLVYVVQAGFVWVGMRNAGRRGFL